MKRMASLFLLLGVFLCNSPSAAQKPQDFGVELQKVRIPEWIDPWGRKPVTYAEFKKSQPPPQPLRIEVLKRLDKERIRYKTKLSSLVLVIVNSDLYPHIEASIAQYQNDLIADGYLPEVILWSGGFAHDLRSYLQSRYQGGLAGAVLVGDLPIAWFEASSPEFPCDLYFMDLDGSWEDADADGILDAHTGGSGDLLPEIWIGRLDSSRLTWGGQVYLLHNYFRKNHDYRTGALSLPHRALVFLDDDFYDHYTGISKAYDDTTMINDFNQTTANEYKSQLMQGYEWIHLAAHSSCWTHTFKTDYDPEDPMEGQSVFNYEIHALNPHAFFYNLYTCNTTRFVETNCLGNWYVFGDEYGLAVLGTAKSGGMQGFYAFYEPLGMGKSIGQSFKEWWIWLGDFARPSWHYGLNILGDPTLTIDRSATPQASPFTDRIEGYVSHSSWPFLQVTTNEFAQSDPAMTLDRSGNPWVVWQDGRYVRCTLFSSEFNGEEWTTPIPIQIYYYYDRNPAISTDSSGNIWVVWVTYVDGNFDICASYHNGTSWSVPDSISTGIQYDIEPKITTDRNGNVWVAWKSWRPDSSQVSSEIMVSYFDGSDWSPQEQLTSDTVDNCDPSITSDQTGKVWVAWASNRDCNWNIYSSYYDGSWSPPVAITTHPEDDLQAKITTDGAGKVWAAWQSFRDGDANIYVSSNDGSSWSIPFQITSDTLDDVSPSFSQNNSGEVWLSWMSKRCGNWDIFLSLYDGSSWSSPRQITAHPGNDYLPVVVADTSGEALVVWATDRDLNWNLYSAFPYVRSPVLTYPPDYSYVNDTTPRFEWSIPDSLDAVTYILQCSQDSSLVSGVTTVSEIAQRFYDLPDTLALTSDTDYFWRVRIVATLYDSSDFSETHRFTLDTGTPGIPMLLRPTDDTIMTNTTPAFEWTSVTSLSKDTVDPEKASAKEAPVRYVLQYSLDSNLVDQVVVVDTITNTEYVVPDHQPLDSCWNYHYWRVQARDLAGNESGYQMVPFRFFVYDPAMIDHDCDVNIVDVVYLINYLLREGPEPCIPLAGDVDCSGDVGIADVVYLINYLFKGGPPPCKT